MTDHGVPDHHHTAQLPSTIFEKCARIDFFASKTCLIVYLAIAVPLLFSLCFLVGPFQGPDEQAHFYRAVQLSEGRVMPVVAPAGHAAGDYLDSNIHRLGGYYLWLGANRGFKSFGEEREDRLAAKQMRLSGNRQFTSFSNTVIYFPIAHAVPALTITMVRLFNQSPMTWLYTCRLVDSLVVLLLFSVVITLYRDGRWFFLLLALLPRTVMQTCTLSADTFLIPFAALFAGLLTDLAGTVNFSRTKHFLLLLSMVFICVCKIAYIPLVALPPLIVAIRDRRLSRTVVLVLCSAAITVATWLAWAAVIKDTVFPIRHDVYINVYGQLRSVVEHPLKGLAVLVRSVEKQGFYYVENLVGGYLGHSDKTRQPLGLTLLGCALLVATALVGPRRVSAQSLNLAVTVLILTGCAFAVFLLLYMQFTALGSPVVEGVQGRYFLPLVPIAMVFLPKFKLQRAWALLGMAALVVWASAASINAVLLIYNRYDVFQPAPDVRISNPKIMQVE